MVVNNNLREERNFVRVPLNANFEGFDKTDMIRGYLQESIDRGFPVRVVYSANNSPGIATYAGIIRGLNFEDNVFYVPGKNPSGEQVPLEDVLSLSVLDLDSLA